MLAMSTKIVPCVSTCTRLLTQFNPCSLGTCCTPYRENPQPPSTPPYRQTAAVLLKDKVQGRTSIEIQLHAGNTDTCSYLGRHPEVDHSCSCAGWHFNVCAMPVHAAPVYVAPALFRPMCTCSCLGWCPGMGMFHS
eukprot:1156061-Pelagomonas_calceolata.AAC.8